VRGALGIAFIALVTACGARSGLDVSGAPPTDAGTAIPIDARAPVDATTPIDATVPRACPAATGIGFTVVPGARIVPRGIGDVVGLSTAGDGRDVMVAIERAGGIDLHTLDALASSTTLGTTVGLARLPRLAAGDGVFALAHLSSPRDDALFLRRFDARGRELSVATLPFPTADVRALARPAWNGRAWVVGFTDGFEVWLGAVDAAGSFERWLGFGPAGDDIGLGVEPATGRAFALLRTGDGALRVFGFERDGAPVEPREGIVLRDVEWEGFPSFGVRDDRFGQPFLLGGFAADPLDGSGRFTTRAYRLDGSAGSGFSAPASPGAHAHDLTTAPPAGHASGYGVIGADVLGGSWRLRQHGAGEDFVGDSRPVGGARDEPRLGIAAGPCGHVVVWQDQVAPNELRTALAIARAPD
jgi:hypothetical protein